MSATWRSLDEFYTDEVRRLRCPEADYGVLWRRGGRSWPVYRVSLLRWTGELIAVAGTHVAVAQPAVILLGVLPIEDVPLPEIWYAQAEVILDGWADQGPEWPLSWFVERLGDRAHPDAAGLVAPPAPTRGWGSARA